MNTKEVEIGLPWDHIESHVTYIAPQYRIFLLAGAFIIPFVVMLIVVGMPLLLLELGLGQKLRVGAAGAWKLVRLPATTSATELQSYKVTTKS